MSRCTVKNKNSVPQRASHIHFNFCLKNIWNDLLFHLIYYFIFFWTFKTWTTSHFYSCVSVIVNVNGIFFEKNTSKKNKSSNFSKLSIFQPNKYKFKRTCPLSSKGAPTIDYKNVKLLKRYVSENGKILPSRITNISQKKQRELSLSIKRARNLALI